MCVAIDLYRYVRVLSALVLIDTVGTIHETGVFFFFFFYCFLFFVFLLFFISDPTSSKRGWDKTRAFLRLVEYCSYEYCFLPLTIPMNVVTVCISVVIILFCCSCYYYHHYYQYYYYHHYYNYYYH